MAPLTLTSHDLGHVLGAWYSHALRRVGFLPVLSGRVAVLHGVHSHSPLHREGPRPGPPGVAVGRTVGGHGTSVVMEWLLGHAAANTVLPEAVLPIAVLLLALLLLDVLGRPGRRVAADGVVLHVVPAAESLT